MHIKKGDTVKILSGDDKGKTGKVIKAFPATGKVLIEGMNMMKRHEKSRKQGTKGQIVDRAMPMHASKVAKAE
ncbi:MAG TPA: 50S ribosomal protein L24 [Candidatus Paceibacterota bacterium]|jgi:large subunit ribosomal protein L24|nr:50S ribosomal protein L24 [Candidatus Paceibacterota bacterium]